jgi:hypothetical protein
MDNDRQNPGKPPAVIELWRKAGVDFDRGSKSTLAQLLDLGGYFPLAKVEDRLPMSRSRLYQWSRGNGDLELTSCFVPIRAKGKGRALTILVDLVRLNDHLSAQVQSRVPAYPSEPQSAGAPALSR